MTYHNAIKFIKGAPNVTPSNSHASKRIQMLLDALGNPQKKIKYVRLAGSNGKTVCAKMITSILNEAGISNGCLSMPISPEIRHNVLINGEPISMDETVEHVEKIRGAICAINDQIENQSHVFAPTVHEILLCLALLSFTGRSCSVCVIESDHRSEDPSKFLPSPFAAVICGRIPNEEKQEMATIRSYICRGIREIVSSPQNPMAYKMISDTCFEANCRLTLPAKNKFSITSLSLRETKFSYKDVDYSLSLCGRFEIDNALVAIESAKMLSRCGYTISDTHIKDGLRTTRVPSKFEVLSIFPTIIADSTYKDVAIGAVCDSLADFKELTGTKIRLCLPEGELIPKYILALEARGYEIEQISAQAMLGEDALEYPLPVNISKNAKLTAKDALRDLGHDSMLLISGPSNFTNQLRHEILAILGF